ncbi:BRCA1 C Terminus (BRCT) domain [Geosmithia morbida]|uniref:BRCA1 C Terminus (BRCT) domain n=1 Tax=Geosmithia morbida TaxID=1094350 RepID=A0A9P5D8J7_9HYPO|nr:BRCA1 C Terminus (BRCT) domain [Geosmithia morbida]KAF4125599.1 BRCA1 C Terminus (BRCT) domain [Geosmithia morbida]
MGDDGKGGLFAECVIAFVPSSSLAPREIASLTSVVEDNGATVCEPRRRDGSIAVEKATHIISNTIDFPQFTESQAVMIPVVTTQWIVASVHRRKQANVRPFSPDPRMIFSQVVVSCGDLPPMDTESILGATMALGGQESKDANRLTTHICTLTMGHEKIRVAREKGWKGKIVLPHWFDDCFKLGKRIDEGPYLLPDPEILKKSPDDDLDIPENAHLDGASSTNPQWLPLPPDSDVERPPATVLQGRKVMLSADLSITKRFMTAISDIIANGGGKVVNDVDACDMFICQYRDGEQYVRAAQSCKDVGNLSWLYYLIVRNEWTSPLRRLMHYPIPRDGIEGFRGKRITVSNYGGEARIYLENLIKACGAEFTKTMRADNTHLITARNTSEKCRAAPEWGIAVINHLWIEECYAKCEMKPYNISKYNHFPPRTNLGEIIGQTFFDESRLRELYYPGGEETLSPRAKRKRKILEAAEGNAYSHGPAEGVVIGRVGQGHRQQEKEQEQGNETDGNGDVPMADGDDDAAVPAPAEERKKEAPAPARRKSRTVATPTRAAGKENDAPSVTSTGGRSAKAKAREMLQNIAPDIALYEREKKRHSKTGTSPWGGKRALDLVEKEKGSAKKNKAAKEDTEEDDGDGDEEEEEGGMAEDVPKRPAKKARTSLPEVNYRIILTGFNRWVGNKNKESQDRKKLRDMGILIVREGQACDYLAAPHIVRTVKFLSALARGPTVISSTFVEKALETGKVPESPEDFVLKDREAEKRYNISLDKSVRRAKANRGRLLWGVPVYCTENIRNGSESYKAIAEANSAIFKLYRARSGSTIKPTTAEEDGGRPPEPVYLLSNTSAEEKKMWPRFRDMAEKGNMEPRIVAPDWLLDVAMAQQVRFDEKFLVENFFKDE